MLLCPFCGAQETDRFLLEGRRFVVFSCQFTPAFEPGLDDAAIAARLAADFGPQGNGYFRQTCDRLHRYVTVGAGAGPLRAAAEAPRSP